MSHQRTQSTVEAQKEPHSVSIKVLRLSRPSFSYQYPLPQESSEPDISPKAALSYPSGNGDDQFILSPLLTLPPAFGSAYVGETFSCTLCANNELLDSQDARLVSSVRISAEMQTPSQTLPLELTPSDDDRSSSGLKPGQSLQKIVRFDLKEAGNHILTVSVNYSETSISAEDNSAASGRVRTFRKLYQFTAQPCLSVRTKASELPPAQVQDTDQLAGKARPLRFALEAQLENLADGAITLQRVSLQPNPPFKSTSINWDTVPDGVEKQDLPKLAPQDVWQVAFLLEQQKEDPDGSEAARKGPSKDGRVVLGQLNIQWRSSMGDPGMLSTGWLTTRRR